jgi:hypothetical protein
MKRALLLLCFLPWLLSASSQKPVKVNVTKPGTLSTLLTQAQQDTCQYLIVSGKLNSADIKVLRKMAGADGRGKLTILNLMNATIVSSEVPYLTIRNAEEKILPNVSSVKVSVGPMGRELRWGGLSPEIPSFPTLGNDLLSAKLILPNQAEQPLDVNAVSQNLSLWKAITKIKLKGHTIIEGKDGHYTYSAFTHKKHFCRDMFYHCPNLKQVIVPEKGKMYEDVSISRDPVNYNGNIKPRYIYVRGEKKGAAIEL